MFKFAKKFVLFCLLSHFAITPSYAAEQIGADKPLKHKVSKTHDLFWNNPLEELQKELRQDTKTLFNEQSETQNNQSIRDLYYIALNYSPSLQNNIANLNVAYASQLTVDSVFYPTISANYSLRRSDNNQIASYNQNVFSLSLLQHLYNAESFARADQTQVQIDHSKIALQATRQQLILDTAKRWTEALLAQDNNQLSNIDVKSSKKIFDKAQQSFQVGLGKKLDVAQAQAAYRLAIATQIQRKSNYTVALQNLTNLTGIKINSIPKWKKQSKQKINTSSYAQKIQNNIHIQRQLKVLESATLDVNAVRGKLYPNVSLLLTYNNTQYTETGSELDVNDPILLTLQFGWELFSGFRTTADIDKSYAMLNQQKAQLKTIVLQQKAQLSNIMALLQADEQRIPAIKQQVDAAKIAYDAFLQGYELGTENLPNVLNAQKDYQQAKITLSQSTYQHWINYLNFKFITGQINASDLPQ